MTEKKVTLTVLVDLSDLFTVESEQKPVTPTKERFGMRVQLTSVKFFIIKTPSICFVCYCLHRHYNGKKLGAGSIHTFL